LDDGTLAEQAFAVIHCTLGDVLIALSSLMLALVIAGDHAWPRDRFWSVAMLGLIFGVAYIAFSECSTSSRGNRGPIQNECR
jgi:hypothetical protein